MTRARGLPDEDAIRRSMEASLRSMATMFAGIGTSFAATVAADLKSDADRMKWAGEPLAPSPSESEFR